MRERQLTDEVIQQELWLGATQELFAEDWETREQAEYYGLAFADSVVEGELCVNILRDMATHANQLEKEALEKAGGDIENLKDDADYMEAIGRRIAHQSLRYALSLTKTQNHRMNHRGDYRRRNGMGTTRRMPGLGSHDWSLL